MAKPKTVVEYLASLPPVQRASLKKLRAAIKSAAPKGKEVISYSVPAVRLNDRILVWFAAWKDHTSMYPISAAFAKRHAIRVDRYELSKGTIRFPLEKPIPVTLVKRLVKARIADLRR